MLGKYQVLRVILVVEFCEYVIEDCEEDELDEKTIESNESILYKCVGLSFQPPTHKRAS